MSIFRFSVCLNFRASAPEENFGVSLRGRKLTWLIRVRKGPKVINDLYTVFVNDLVQLCIQLACGKCYNCYFPHIHYFKKILAKIL